MRRDLLTSLVAVLACTALLGLAYPLAVAGIAQVAFPVEADGDPALLADDRAGDARYFQPRPSATGHSATATAFANRGPNQASAAAYYRAQVAAYRKRYGAQPPPDAVTMSASGVDPHISPANAHIQARSVAAARRLPLRRVDALIAEATEGGLFGPEVVNTTTLNEALDR